MSTTAGVGAHDYVEVNPLSVVAVLGGMASGLALLSPYLLVIPALVMLLALVSLVQISRSNGTQTGKLLAVLGIVLAMALGGYVGAQVIKHRQDLAANRVAISQLIDRFGATANTAAAKECYQLFGPLFQQRIKLQQFEAFLQYVEGLPGFGKIVGVEWNGMLEVLEDPNNDSNDVARAALQVKFDKANVPVRVEATFFRRPLADGGKGPWVIETIPPLFEQQQGGGGTAGGSPGGE